MNMSLSNTILTDAAAIASARGSSKGGVYRPSSLWNCPRRMALTYLGYNLVEPKSEVILALGTWLHESMLAEFSSLHYEGMRIEHEVRVSYPPLKLSGTADLLIHQANSVMLVDLKTGSGRPPKDSWVYQLEAYLRCLQHEVDEKRKAEEARLPVLPPEEYQPPQLSAEIWDIHRAYGSLNVFSYSMNEEIWANIQRKIGYVNDCLESDTLPPMSADPTFDLRDTCDTDCRKCPLHRHCLVATKKLSTWVSTLTEGGIIGT